MRRIIKPNKPAPCLVMPLPSSASVVSPFRQCITPQIWAHKYVCVDQRRRCGIQVYILGCHYCFVLTACTPLSPRLHSLKSNIRSDASFAPACLEPFGIKLRILIYRHCHLTLYLSIKSNHYFHKPTRNRALLHIRVGYNHVYKHVACCLDVQTHRG